MNKFGRGMSESGDLSKMNGDSVDGLIPNGRRSPQPQEQISPSTSYVSGELEEGYNSQDEVVVNLDNQTSLEFNPQPEEDEKSCWVCFASESDEPNAQWSHPCRCRGTTKWVHQACIQRWIDEKQKGNSTQQVECPQCGTAYLIRFPASGRFVSILETSDKLVQRLCPIIAGGVCVGSLYWTCITFGAVTIMQSVGHDQGLILMERADPLLLLVSLPLVPVGLVLGKMIRWEDAVISFLRSTVPRSILFRNLLPIFAESPERPALQSPLPPLTDHVSVTRTFCGALFFPTIASFLGKALFDQVPSQLQRTLLGGLTFVVVKGVLKIYFKQHTFVRQCHRRILDFNET